MIIIAFPPKKSLSNALQFRRLTALLVYTCLMLSSISNSHADTQQHISMIKNGNFEDMFDEQGIGENWYYWPVYNENNGIVLSFKNDPHHHEGNGAQQILCSAYESGMVTFINESPIPVRNGHDYKISLWMKGQVNSSVGVRLQNLGASPYSVYMEEAFEVTDQWQHYEFTSRNITCTDDTCEARLRIVFTSTGSLSIDNVRVYDLEQPVIGGTVYIDADDDTGNNANDGMSPSTPWRTIEKLDEYDIMPGARILFKSGGEWRGQVILPPPVDDAEDVIYYGRYGTGPKPIINGAVVIDNWRPYDDGNPNTNIFVAENVIQPISQLIVDDRRQTPARYPNQASSDALSYHLITSACGEDSHDCLIDSEHLRQSDPDVWTDATVFIRTRSWRIEKAKVTDFVPTENKITFSPPTSYDAREGSGYYIEGKFELLDAAGEWFHDAEGQKLYYWPMTGTDIHKSIIEASVAPYGISAASNRVENIIIENFDLRNYSDSGIMFQYASNAQFRGNRIQNCGKNGIEIGVDRLRVSENITIEGNEISLMQQHGITVQKAVRVKIEKNEILNSGRRGILYHANADGQVKNNQIRNSGYSGITLHGESLANNRIEGNIIDRSCLLLDDGAGIYLSGRNGENNQIKNNIITNAIGNYDGKPSKTTEAQGLYMDERASHVRMTGNVLVNVDYGIQIHNAHSHTIENNIVYNARNAGACLTHNGEGKIDRPVYGNIMSGKNIFHSLNDRRACVHLGTVFKDCDNCEINGFAAFDSNYYAHPNIDFTFFQRYPGGSDAYTLAQWQTTTGHDRNSKIFDGTRSEIFINAEQEPRTFEFQETTYVTMENEPVGVSIEVAPLSAVVLIRKELNCTDGLDNDGDSLVDDDDPDCSGAVPQDPDNLIVDD